MVNCVDSKIFMVNNKNVKLVGFPNSNSCESNSYGIEFSFKFLQKKMNVVSIPEIKSSIKDDLRMDIGNSIKLGKKIICPVVSSSVRERFI